MRQVESMVAGAVQGVEGVEVFHSDHGVMVFAGQDVGFVSINPTCNEVTGRTERGNIAAIFRDEEDARAAFIAAVAELGGHRTPMVDNLRTCTLRGWYKHSALPV